MIRTRPTLRRSLVAGLALALLAGCSGREEARPSGVFEATEIRLSPALAGRIVDLRADEGAAVAAGDTLLVLDGDLARLERARTATSLATLAARRLRAADGLQEAEAAAGLAERSHRRLQALREQGSASEQQLDEAATALERARQALSGLRHELAALDAERASVEAGLAVQDRRLEDLVLVAPSAGTVLERYAEPGEWIVPGQAALRLADLGSLELRFYLGETDLGLVRLGQELAVSVDTFPGESFAGRVAWISSEAEFTPKNVQTREARSQLVYAVRAAVANPAGRLAIGMPADVRPGGASR